MTEPLPPSPAIAQLSSDFAKIRYEASLTATYERSKSVMDFALLGLRSLIIVNGGALVGLVTFIGNFGAAEDNSGAVLAFTLFVFGLFSGFLAVLFSYLAQQHFFWSETHDCDREAREMFGLDTNIVRADLVNDWKIGTRYQIVAIVIALLSALMFVIGALAALNNILA